jgi:hypothetical protein
MVQWRADRRRQYFAAGGWSSRSPRDQEGKALNPRHLGAAAAGAAALSGAVAAGAQAVPSTTATTTYHRAQVDGVAIFKHR